MAETQSFVSLCEASSCHFMGKMECNLSRRHTRTDEVALYVSLRRLEIIIWRVRLVLDVHPDG